MFHACAPAGSKAVTVVGPGGERHSLSRYFADWALPRPESWREDAELAEGLPPDEARARRLARCGNAFLILPKQCGWDECNRCVELLRRRD